MRKLLSIILSVIIILFPAGVFCEDISAEFGDYLYSMKVGRSFDILPLLEITSSEKYEISYRFYSSDEGVAVIIDNKIYTVSVGNSAITAVVYFNDGVNTYNKYAVTNLRVARDGNMVITPDTNRDGIINSEDLSAVLADYGRDADKCDFDGSGEVNNSDLSIILHRYGNKI